MDYTKGAGKKIRTGTNPEAISIPHKDGILTLDMAYTRLAASYALKCLKANEKVKMPGYLADVNFLSTLDPKDVFYTPEEGKCGFRTINGNDAAVFQLGSAAAGYKGDGKLRMIEADNALGGGPIKKVEIDTKDPDRRISHTFLAQAVDFYYSKEEALTRVTDLIKDYRTYFGESSRWCGERAIKAAEYARKEGIPYSEGQIKTLERAAAEVGMQFNVMSLGNKEFVFV